ncbi:hypothetical protein BgiBS90_014365, partial [Biomphalaria glabrata]
MPLPKSNSLFLSRPLLEPYSPFHPTTSKARNQKRSKAFKIVAAIVVTFFAPKVIPARLAHHTVTDNAPIPSASITTVCAATVLT